MDPYWIDTLMDLNERITAMEVRLSAQATRIVEMMEAGKDIASAEGVFISYHDGLGRLRQMRDGLLIKGEG